MTQSKKRVFDFYQLEDRILLDGEGIDSTGLEAGDANLDSLAEALRAELANEAPSGEYVPPPSEPGTTTEPTVDPLGQDVEILDVAGEPLDASRPLEVIFVDAGVEDADILIQNLRGAENETQWIIVHIDANEDGVDRITETLSQLSGVDAVHLLSHGDGEGLQLGNRRLDLETAPDNAGDIASWGYAMDTDADLLIYGCDLASTEAGRDLIDILSIVCDCDVAASEDLTGHESLGGDWELEYIVGVVETDLAFQSSSLANWHGLLATYTVTNTNNTGAGSFRQAIIDANNNAGTDSIHFNISASLVGGVHTISIDTDDGQGGAMPTITETVIIDATTEPDYSGTPIVVLDGSNSTTNSGRDGITLAANNSEIRGLVISGFYGNGISITGDNNTVAGNYIGTNASGTATLTYRNEENGILVTGSGNTIGGTTTADRNLISANNTNGVTISGAGSGNTIQGNFIGTNASGIGSLGNLSDGVQISGSDGNFVLDNVISGNSDDGVTVTNGADNNIFRGNYIGTNAAGTGFIANGDDGIVLFGNGTTVTGNIIGGSGAGEGNVISGNTDDGIFLTNATNSTIQGNYIGLNASGTGTIANGDDGIEVFGNSGASVGTSSGTIIGGTSAGEGNVISGNTDEGIYLANVTNTQIEGNFVGLNAAGTSAIGNGDEGIFVSNSTNTTIGDGTTGGRNVISGNTGHGILVDGASTNTTTISGNYIGLNAAGTGAIANSDHGIVISGGATNTLIGGASAGERNVISGNTANGIGEYGGSATVITGNYIGTDKDGTGSVGNGQTGIAIVGANGVQIGGTGAGEGNVISANTNSGIYAQTADSLIIQGNYIGVAADGTTALGNNDGIHLETNVTNALIGGTVAAAENIIAFSTVYGIFVQNSTTITGNSIRRNSIHSNGGLGIDLHGNGVTANDTGDGDTGGNGLQNFPVLTSVETNGTNLVQVVGSINSTANTTFVIDLYGNTTADPLGHGEGETWIGEFRVTTDASGNATFDKTIFGSLPIGHSVSATATVDNGDGSYGNTSEFAANQTAVSNSFAPSDLQAIQSEGGVQINSDGGNDIYFLADSSSFFTGNMLTMEFQISDLQNTGTRSTLFSNVTGAGTADFVINSDGTLAFVGFASTNTALNLFDGEDHNVAFTWNGSTGEIRYYVDGELLQSVSGPAGSLAGGDFMLGQDQDSLGGTYDSNETFSGTFRDVRIFTAVRTDAQLQASYDSTLPHHEDSLVVNWTFDQLSPEGIVTDEVAGNNLTVRHVSQSGFSTSEASLTLQVEENALDGTQVGVIDGDAALREAQINFLLNADSSLHYSEVTGKFYKAVAGPIDWTAAKSAAESTALNTVNGQLATIRSAAENAIVTAVATDVGGSVFLGGTDATVEGEWRWVESGSEADLFYDGDYSTGYVPHGVYENWFSSTQPNDLGGAEDAVRLDSTSGFWYDAPSTGSNHNYVIEWDADEVLDASTALTYTIQSQTVNNAFVIDSDSGVITVLDGNLLNHESAAVHSVTVRVSDGSQTYDEVFSIAIEDRVETNNAPTSLNSGINLNHDGGNDAYLISAGGLASSLSATTFELQFSAQNIPDETVFLSFNNATGDEFSIQINDSSGGLELDFGSGSTVVSTAIAYESVLLDGENHTLSVTWDNTFGDWSVYIDGERVDNGTGLNAGASLDTTNGQFVFGQEQDGLNSGYSSTQYFSGTLYDVRIWNEVRTAEEIALNDGQRIDSGSIPSSLVANWQMTGFNGSNQVVDVVGSNHLSVAHASGAGYVASTPSAGLNVDEGSSTGTTVGYIVPTDPDLHNDIVSDGLFREAADPGSFQTYGDGSTIGNWSVSGTGVVLAGSVWDSTPLGGRSIELATSGPGAISQTLTTEVGRTYQVVFVESGDWTSDSNLEYRVSAAGESQDLVSKQQSSWTYTNMLWNHRSLTFTANDTSTVLTFESLESGSSAAVIGDVRVIEIPTAVQTVLNNDSTLSYNAATGKFYRVIDSGVDGATAFTNAQADLLNGVGGQLVTIRSALENQYLDNLIQDYSQATYYLGGTDATTEGTWRWIEDGADADTFWVGAGAGSAPDGSYANFYPGEPNEASGEDYVLIRKTDGLWMDLSGVANHGYIVEWDAAEVLGSYTFSLTDSASNRFAIDASTGEITIGSLADTDFETTTSYNITAQVQDATGQIRSEVLTVTINDIQDETPTNTVPSGQTINEGGSLTFNAAGSNLISLFDDAGATLRVTLNVSDGTLALSTVSGLTFHSSGNHSSQMTFSGTVESINAALDGLVYTPETNFGGSDTLTITTSDEQIYQLNIDSDLLGYYEFTSAAPGADSSPTGTNTVTLMGDASVTSDPVRGDVLSLDGTGDYAQITSTFTTPSAVTIGGWVNFTSSGRSEFVSLHDRVHIALDDGSAGVKGSVQIGSGSWNDLESGVSLSGTGWHHIMYTYDDAANIHRLFIDGELVASETINDSVYWTGATTTYIGRHPNNSAYDLNGLVDDVRIYDRAISDAEIASLASVPGPHTDTDQVAITVTAVNDAPEFRGAELITNGDIAGNSLAGWTTTGTVTTDQDAIRFGEFNSVGPHTASQTIATTSGETYRLIFDYRDDSTTRNQSLQVTVDGSSNLLTTSQIITDSGGNSFVRYEYTFTADSSNATVTFTDTSDTAGVSDSTTSVDGYLDNISVRQVNGNLAPASYVEDGSPAVLAPDLTIFDQEIIGDGVDTFENTEVSIVRNGGANSEDVFSATGNLGALVQSGNLVLSSSTVGTVVTNSGGTLVLRFDSSATEAIVNEVIQSIAYENTSETPPANVQLNWSFEDDNVSSQQGTGGELTATASTLVNITATNDIPVLSVASSGPPNYTENAGGTFVDTAATVNDVDSLDFDGGTLTLSIASGGNADDRLIIQPNGTGAGEVSLSGSNIIIDTQTVGTFSGGVGSGDPLIISFNANASSTEAQAILRRIAFSNVSDDPGSTDRNIDVVLTDGDGGTSATSTRVMSINTINDTPVISGPGSALSATEQVGLAIHGTGFTVSDADAGSSNVLVTLNVGEGRLLITPGDSGVTVVSGNSTDNVIITGTVDQVDDLLTAAGTGTIVYTADTDAPSSSTTITVTINDQGNSGADPGLTGGASDEEATAAQTINITQVNDAPGLLGGELVSNGDFTTDIAGWTTTGTVDHNSGSLRFGAGDSAGPHTAAQTITTVIGETYTIEFDHRDGPDPSYNQSIQLSVDGSSNVLTTAHLVSDFPTTASTAYRFTFVADSTSTTITFTDTSDTAGLSSNTTAVDGYLDNVSVRQMGGLLSTVSFTEDSTAVVLDNDVLFSDPELEAGFDSYGGIDFSLQRTGAANADDVFVASGNLGALTEGGNLVLSSTTIGTVDTNSGGVLNLRFNATATEATINETLQSIAYSNASNTPPSSVQLDWSMEDSNLSAQGTGGNLFATGHTIVNITANNDLPVLGNQALTISEGGQVTLDSSMLSASDVDDNDPDLTFVVSSDSNIAFRRLSDGVVVTSFTQSEVTAGDIVAIHDGSDNSPSFSIAVDDGTDTTTPAAISITYSGVNDVPYLDIHGEFDETIVNTTTAGDQQQPQVTTLAGGNYVIAWNDGVDTRAQIFADDGSTVGGELVLDDTASVGQTDITATAGGGFVATWYSGGNIYARAFNASGTALAASTVVATGASSFAPEIVELNSGQFAVTFGQSSDTRVQLLTSAMALDGSVIDVADVTAGTQTLGHITALADGGFMVAFSDANGRDGETWGIYAQRFDASGAAVGGNFLVSQTTSGAQRADSIEQLAGGNIVITWRDNVSDGSSVGTLMRVFSSSGAVVTGEILLAQSTAGAQDDAHVTALTDGTYVVTWHSGGANGIKEAFIRHFAADGTALSDEMLLNTTSDNHNNNPQATELTGNRVAVTWTQGDSSGSNTDIVQRHLDFDGQTLTYTENDAASSVLSEVSLVDFDDTHLQSATIQVSGGYVNGEDILGFVDTANITGSWVAATGALTLTGSDTIAAYEAALANVTYFNSSQDPTLADRTVSWSVNDGTDTSQLRTSTVSVLAANDAPVLDNSGTMTLTTISEDDINNGGTSIAAILSSAGGDRLTDVDSSAQEGIALTNLNSSTGTWEYSINGGSSWTTVGAVSDSSALLLRDTDLLRFVPDQQNATTAGITFRGWDQTSGSAGTKVDASTNGGTTAFSTATETASISVTNVNDAPVLDNSGGPFLLTSVSEDNANPTGDTVASMIASLSGDRITDVDTGAIEGIAIRTTSASNGTWQYQLNGTSTWVNVGTVTTGTSLLLAANDSLRFLPDAQNGETATLDFVAWDRTSGTTGTKVDTSTTGGSTAFSDAQGTAQITVTDVNDAPTINDGATYNLAGTNEDTTSSPTTVATVVNGVSWNDVDTGASRGLAITGLVGNGTWEYSSDGTNWTSFGAVSATNALLLDGNSQVRYVPDAVSGETATFDFVAWDITSGTASTSAVPSYANPSPAGGTNAYSTESATASIAVSDVNDAVIAVADADNADEAGGVANGTPGNNPSGNVLSNDTEVDSGDTLSVIGVAAGTVSSASGNVASSVTGTYGSITIAANGNYTYNVDNSNAIVQSLRTSSDTITDTFTYTVQDSGGAVSTTQVVLTIRGQNDAPVSVTDNVTATEAGGDSNASAGSNPTGNVLTNDTDVDAGDTKTVTGVVAGTAGSASGNVASAVTGTYGSITINADGSFVYNVDNSNAAVEALRTSADTLSDTFTYTMVDTSGASSTTQVVVTIEGQNDDPGATNDTGTASEAGGVANASGGSNAVGNVLTNDTDVDSGDTQTVVGVAVGSQAITSGSVGVSVTGSYGSITIASDGSYTYVVDDNNAAVQALRTSGETLNEVFSYTMNDTLGADSTAEITITITGENDAPVAVANAATAVEASGILNNISGTDPSGNLLANDTDVDAGDTQTVTGVATGVQSSTSGSVGSAVVGTYGQLTVQSDGSYTYVLDNSNATVEALNDGDSLNETFSYTVTDTAGLSSTTQIVITIDGRTDDPFAVVDADTSEEAGGVANATPGSNPSGNVLDNDVGGAGKTVTGVAAGSTGSASGNVGVTVTGLYGDVVINADGSYTYTLNNSLAAVEALRTSGENLTDVFTYSMVDASMVASSAELTITVEGQNDNPIAGNDSGTAVESGGLNNATAGSDAVGNVLTDDTDVDSGDTKTVVGVALGTVGSASGSVGASVTGNYGSIVINNDGSYTYTIDENDSAVQALRTSGDTLQETFTYTMQDTFGAESSAQVTITLQGANDTPTAVVDTAAAFEAGGINNASTGADPSGNVLTNDTDVDAGDTKTIIGVATGVQSSASGSVASALAGSYGSITINADGSYTYVVDNTNAAVQALRTSGQTLDDVFTYTMQDASGASSTTQITVTVHGANDNVNVTADSATATEAGGTANGTAGTDPTGNVLTNDSDVDAGDTITVSGVAAGTVSSASGSVGASVAGSYGSILIANDGSYTYTVDNSNAAVQDLLSSTDTLTDTFTYTVQDTLGAESTTQITVTIEGANDAPTSVEDYDDSIEAGGVANGTAGTNPTGNVLSNDDQIDAGDTWSITGVASGVVGNTSGSVGSAVSGSYGSLTINSDGSYSYVLDNSNATVQALRTNTDTLTDVFSYTVDDGLGLDTTTQITITIRGRNDAPVAVVDSATAVEAGGTANGTAGTDPTGNVLTNDTDVDAGDSQDVIGVVAGVQSSASGNVGSTVVGSFGSINIAIDGSYTYTVDNSNLLVQALRNTAATLIDTFTYTVEDADGATSTTQISVTIQGANDAPVTAAIEGTPLAYTENDGAVSITQTLTVSDFDDANIASAVVQITGAYLSSEDELAFTDQNGITGSWDSGSGTLTLSGSATRAQYQAALRSVTYENTSADPNTTTREVSFFVNDSEFNSNVITRDINISPQNDEQVLATNTGRTVVENSLGNVIDDAHLETTDLDNTDAQLVYTINTATSHGTLRRSGVALGASDTFTQADLDAMLITYDHSGDEFGSDSFTFTVDDGAGIGSSGTFNITVTPVNDQTPIIQSDGAGANAALNVDENTTAVTTVVATDGDLPAETITYSIVGGADSTLFSIGSLTGDLTFLAAPDREIPSDANLDNVYVVVVQASDGTFSDTQTLSITIDDVDDFDVTVPTDSDGASNEVDENVATGTTVGLTANAFDGDVTNNTVTYSLTSNPDGLFQIHSTTGVVTTAAAIDREVHGATRSITVQALSSDGSSQTQTFNININDIDEFDVTVPTDSDAATNEVDENVTTGTTVGVTADAFDLDATNNTITYSLTSNPDGLFQVHSTTGVVTTAAAIDRELHGATRSITVQALSSDGSSQTQTFNININDVDEFDVTVPTDSDAATNEVDENVATGTTVGVTADAFDLDATNNTITYSLTSNPDGLFQVHSTTGVVTTAAAIDREVHGATRSITVQALSSDGSIQTQTFNININDVDEFDVTVPTDSDSATNEVDENVATGTTVGVTANAFDLDATNNTITYSLTSNPDGLFQVHSTTGVVTTAAAIDREVHGATRSITVQALSSDGSSQTQSFNITINDLDDFDVTVPTDSDGATNEVDENVATGTVVGLTANAFDGDATNNTITYSLTSNPDGLFQIHSTTGVVTTAAAIDRELHGATRSITVQALSSDGSSQTQSFNININDVDEFDVTVPTDSDAATNEVDENVATGTTVGVTANAFDLDATNNTITYSLTSNPDGLFQVHSTTGVVTTAAAIDREVHGATRSITVQALSSDGSSQTQSFNITINDLDDFDVTVPTDSDGATNEVDENVATGTVVGLTANAFDGDATNNTITYSLTSNPDGLFQIHSTTGVVTTAAAIDRELHGATRSITVQALSSDGSSQTQSFNININDVDEFDVTVPTDSDAATNEVDENVATGTTVGVTANAFDGDATNNTITYSLTSNPDGLFQVHSTTGVVTTAAAIDREVHGATRSITVQALSSDGSSQTQSFNITINDLDDFDVTVPTDSDGATNEVDENVATGTVVGLTANAFDGDATNNTITYSLTSNPDGLFQIHSTTGVVTTAAAIDRELHGATRSITVQALSSDGSSQTQSFNININDVDEFDVTVPTDSDAATNEGDENVATGTTVGVTANAFDLDATNNTITYSLTSNPDGLFQVHSTTGVVTTAAAIDREVHGATRSITVQALSSDGSSQTQSFNININDVDDFDVSAITDSDLNPNSVQENVPVGTAVGITAFAVDADATNNGILYTLDNDAGGRFTIDGVTGIVTVNSSLDNEASLTHTIVVRATSDDGSTITQSFNIAIEDVNEFAPVVTPGQSFAVAENSSVGVAVGTVVGTDIDTTAVLQNWAIVGGDPDNQFAIDASTGLITVAATSLDHETTDQYTLQIQVEDGLFVSTIETVVIQILDVNEAPTAVSDSYTTISEQTLRLDTPLPESNDFDPEGDTLSVVVLTQPTGGTLTIAPDGTLVYDPSVGFFGFDTFTYLVTDGSLQSNAATITVDVQAVPITDSGGDGGSTPDPDPEPDPDPDPEPEDQDNDNQENEENNSEEDGSSDSTESTSSSGDGEGVTGPLDHDARSGPASAGSADGHGGIASSDGAGGGAGIPGQTQLDVALFLRSGSGGLTNGLVRTGYSIAELEVMNQMLSVDLQNAIAWASWESSEELMEQEHSEVEFTIGAAATTIGFVSIGYVLWTLRGGMLLATLYAGMPSWQMIDPSALLSTYRAGRDEAEDEIERLMH